MNIEDVKKKKEQLEKILFYALLKFEEETGTQVTDVRLHYVSTNNMGEHSMIKLVEVDTTVEV